MNFKLKQRLESLPETNAQAVLQWLEKMENKVFDSIFTATKSRQKVEIRIEEMKDAERVALEWLQGGDYTYTPRMSRPMSEEQKAKISATMKGRKLSEITKERMRENAQRCTVYQYDLDNNLISVYKSTRDAERRTGFNNSRISACCRNGGKAYGFHWSYKPIDEDNPIVKVTVTSTIE